jgi:hypothetical protein
MLLPKFPNPMISHISIIPHIPMLLIFPKSGIFNYGGILEKKISLRMPVGKTYCFISSKNLLFLPVPQNIIFLIREKLWEQIPFPDSRW